MVRFGPIVKQCNQICRNFAIIEKSLKHLVTFVGFTSYDFVNTLFLIFC